MCVSFQGRDIGQNTTQTLVASATSSGWKRGPDGSVVTDGGARVALVIGQDNGAGVIRQGFSTTPWPLWLQSHVCPKGC